MKENKVLQPGALSLDSSLVTQPQGTTRFVLNGVNETKEGDLGFRANEESNEACYSLPATFVPIGEVYIGDENTLLFLASPAGNSVIGIADRNCNFNVIVNDTNQDEKLGFKISKQISATFRLRRGCERVVYWVDPKPRVFVIDREEKFKTQLGQWDISKFNLFKLYNSIPKFEKIEVLNTGGTLLSGSYNVSVQYLDEDLNPTEFTTSSEVVYIYNDSFAKDYLDIRGSINQAAGSYLSTPTNKAIRIELSELDLDFPFYRLAFTEANNGSGQISDTKYTAEISTRNPVFTYTGDNFQSSGTQEDITIFNNIIDSAEHIEQIENKLILSNVKGKQVNYCGLQRYASKIEADCILSTVILNKLEGSNPKKANSNVIGVPYTPGEIHSFGIVYVFDDMTLTPTYHIPGKSSAIGVGTTFLSSTVNKKYYPMSTDNQSATSRYIDNDSCDNLGYWGVDSEGTALKNTLVRHHRFPLRSEINKPLFTEVLASETSTEFHTLRIRASGTIVLPPPCITDAADPAYDPNCIDPESIEYTVEYIVDGVTSTVTDIIEYENWDEFNSPGYELYLSPFLTSTAISIVSVKENGVLVSPGVASANGFTYIVEDVPYVAETESKFYFSEVMNIEFSNIQMPDEKDTGGQKIIGYYIVRNERTENEKTILDSAVLTSTMQNQHFVSHGLLMPDFANPATPKIKRDFLGLINPQYKFNNRTYTEVDFIIKEGEYVYSERGALYSSFLIQDVLDGTSYDSKRHKKSEKDEDGFSLRVRTKDNILKFNSTSKPLFVKNDLKEIFYLDALSYKNVEDSSDVAKDVFNISSDNKIGIISLNENFTDPIINTLPYVILKRDIADSYSNFRTLPYYKESKNMVKFIPNQISKTVVSNGDSCITSMRYVNSLFYENRIKQRRGKKGIFTIIAGIALVIIGVAAAIFSAGTSLALSSVGLALIAGAGAAAISGGALLAASGIKQDNWVKTYNELYDQGLRETVEDDFLNDNFKAVNPPDDEIRWYGEGLTNLWFESSVNMSLRYGANVGTIPDFLNSPGVAETGNGGISTGSILDRLKDSKKTTLPSNALDRHLLTKLTAIDQERKSGRTYLGLALPELYQINPDYNRKNKQKIFNHLALEYDCCSDCRENFPHRTHWSEESFQEELTDNYRTFLPNNYRDLEGETGVITDVFRIQNNLYIHTEEALWHLPQTNQERVTGDIVSFLGTGGFFNVPPRKIVDDSNSSAGTSHKWGRIKTKYGVLFPSHKEKKWYMFNGQELKPISDASLSSYFRENMKFKVAEEYYKNNNANYPYDNNPSNPIGVGYISTYDTNKERLIITKKDFEFTNVLGTDYELCESATGTKIFNNIETTIANKVALGFQYLGIENCRLKFQKTIFENRVTTREITTTTTVAIPNEVHVYAFLDTSGSFNTGTYLADLETSIRSWYLSIRPTDTTYTKLHVLNNPTERWINFPATIVNDRATHGGKVLIISLVNEASPTYNLGGLSSSITPTSTYTADYNNFVTNIYPQFSFFKGITYPIATTGASYENSKDYIRHNLLALKGIPYTTIEANAIPVNSAFTLSEWNAVKAQLTATNPYSSLGQGASQYGWLGIVDRNDYAVIAGTQSSIITPAQFASDLNVILSSGGGGESTNTVITTETVTVQVPITSYSYVEGTPVVLNKLNNSYTLSYSLKEEKWISWHSYLPSFYFRTQEKFYGWKQGGAAIYKFNKKNHYQTFFDVLYPFIVEYVDTYGLQTSICDAISFQTEAKQYSTQYEDYIDKKDITFNKLLVYNTHQISGLRNLVTKKIGANYLKEQLTNNINDIVISRSERNWNINELRDLRINHDIPMFSKKLVDLQSAYYIDKIVNSSCINYNKSWMEMESFRDKFLVVRLIFDTFDNTRLIMNFSTQDEKPSQR
jgi:hypothetical protein